MSVLLRTAILTAALTTAVGARVDDVYYNVALGDLKLTEGTLPEQPARPS